MIVMLKRIRMFFVMLAVLMLIAAPAMATDVRNFTELKDAINAGGSITLQENITGITEGLILNQKDVVLDLNGKELSTTDNFNGTFIRVKGCSLKIDNDGAITSFGTTFYITEGGRLEITGPSSLTTIDSMLIGLDNKNGGNTLSISGNAKLNGKSGIAMIVAYALGSYANNISISAGEFHGGITIQGYDKAPENFQITGGAFKSNPSKYLKDNYEAVVESDSLYHVRAKTPAPADIYSLKFERDAVEVLVGAPTRVTTTLTQNGTELPDYGLELAGEVPEWLELKFEGNAVVLTASEEGKCDVTISAMVGGAIKTRAALTVNAVKTQPTPGPIDPAPKPVKPVIGNVSDDVKAEIKPELAVTEGDPAKAAKNIGDALTVEQLTIKDGNTIVKPEVAVKAANKLGTLSSVTSKDVVALPVFTTPAIDAYKDKTIMISYEVLGSDLKAKKPADVKVMKILGAENGELFTYASAITKDMDKKFTVMKDDDSGTIFTGDIDGYTMYRLALFIKDGGKFDLDGKKDGAVADPTVILGAEKRAPSGGCNAGFGVLALLLSLAALPLVYKRKK